MFGNEYSLYPEILFDSFAKMKDEYQKKNTTVMQNKFVKNLISLYINFFGIPEIGMQVRFMHFKKTLERYLPRKMNEILDAGSGIGGYAIELHKKYPYATITGGEIDTKKILLSKKLFNELLIRKVKFQKIDLVNTKLKKNKYNFIVNVDVLEHIRQYKKVLKNFSSSLKRGGYLFIHTPHKNQRRIFAFTEGWHHEDHVREGFALNELSKEVKKSGLQIITAYRSFGPFGRFSWELNHFFLEKSFVLAGITFPVLLFLSMIDSYITDSNGWGIVILAKKI